MFYIAFCLFVVNVRLCKKGNAGYKSIIYGTHKDSGGHEQKVKDFNKDPEAYTAWMREEGMLDDI